MWSFDEGEALVPEAATRPDCPGCGEPDLCGDDFCHECGHGFGHLAGGGRDAGLLDEIEGALPPCPVCASGGLTPLDHGRTQCESCGYMVRDEG